MTRDKLIKKIATWIMMAIMLSVFLLDIICVAMCNRYQNKLNHPGAVFVGRHGGQDTFSQHL